jgi:hypothetical protein
MHLNQKAMTFGPAYRPYAKPAATSPLVRDLAGIRLQVPRAEVAAVLGCPPDATPSARLARQLDDAIDEVIARAEVKVEHRSYPMHIDKGRVHVAGRTTFTTRKLALALESCESIHVFITTLGRKVDRFIDESMRRRPNFGVVVDAAASIAAETMVDRIEQTLSEQLSPRAALSLPFSPGHCDWAVTEQQKLFSLLPEQPAGVFLSADLMMNPRKSITGVLGVGPVDVVTESRNPCRACARTDCAHRRCPQRS